MTQPVVQNQADSTFANNATTRSLSHTVATGTDKFLLVFVQFNSSGTKRSISSIVWDSAGVNESLQFLDAIANDPSSAGDDAQVEVWYLKNPSNGASKNVTVTWDAQVNGPQSIVAYTLTGVDQNYPIRDFGGEGFTSGTSDTVEKTLTTVADDFCAGAATMEFGSITEADWVGSDPTMTTVQDEGHTAGSPDNWFGAAYGFASGTSTLLSVTFDDNDHIAGLFVSIASTGTGVACPGGTPGSCRRTGTNEQISTYGAAGQGRDYTSLATWESDTDVNLVSATESEVLECYDDAASFNDRISMDGATTSALYRRLIRPADGEGHDGTPNNGFTIHNQAAANQAFDIAEDFAVISDILIQQTNPSDTSTPAVFADGSNNVFAGLILFDITSGDSSARGMTLDGNDNVAVNCMILRADDSGYIADGGTSNDTSYYLNCNAIDCGGRGFNEFSADPVWINCLGEDNLGDDFDGGSGLLEKNNASSDATASGTGSRINQSFTFENAGTDDYHLSTSDAGARNYGTDLESYTPFCFNDDIDGETRTTTWDIGFDDPDAATTREFTSTANIVFATNTPEIHATKLFNVAPTITFATNTPEIDQDKWMLADSLSVVVGQNQTGDVEDTWLDNSQSVCWDEEVGSPGLDVRFTFGLVPPRYNASDALLSAYIVHSYDGNLAHIIKLQIWNYDESQWDNVTTNSNDFPDTVGLSDVASFLMGAEAPLWPVTNGGLDEYIEDGGSGELMLRFNHTSSGNVTHTFCVEYLKLDAGHFQSTANIDFTISSDANTQREFASAPSIVFDTTSHINQTVSFYCFDDVIWNTESDILKSALFKCTGALILHSTTSHIQAEREFASQSDIVFDIQSDANSEKQFAVNPSVVFDIQSAGGNAEREFTSTAGIVFALTSDIYNERQFTSQPSIVWDAQSGGLSTEREFASGPSIVFNTTSDIFNTREFASQADIVWSITDPIIRRSIWLNSLADIVFVISSDVQVISDFDVTANVVFDLTSGIFQAREFASQADIVFTLTSDVFKSALFTSTASIVFAISSDAEAEREFTVNPSVVFDAQSGGISTERQFAVQADIVWDIQSAGGNAQREFATTANVVWALKSDFLSNRLFTSTANIVFDLTSDIIKTNQFVISPNIVFDTTTSDANAVRNFSVNAGIVFAISDIDNGIEHDFSTNQGIVFDISSDADAQREFACQGDIVTDITCGPTALDHGHFFEIQADIVFDLTSDIEREYHIASNPGIIFDLTSDMTVDRIFTSQADIVFDITSDAEAEREFASQADVVWDVDGGLINTEREFASQADIVFDITSDAEAERNFYPAPGGPTVIIDSDINAEREFASQSDIVFDTNSDILLGNFFTSQADIVFDTSDPEFYTERHFASQTDIVWNINDIDHGIELNFLIQPSIIWDITDPVIGTEREFASQADIIWDITDPEIDDAHLFSCNPGITFTMRSLMRKNTDFIVRPDIAWDINNPAWESGGTPREFTSQADIVWDIESTIIGATREFASQADIVWDITDPEIGKENRLVSQADIIFDITDPDIFAEREFASQADIVWDITDPVLHTEREFASQSDIVFDTNSDIRTEREFASAGPIVFDAQSGGISTEREFASQADVVFATTSDISNDRDFASTANIVFNTQSQINLERLFAATSDTVFFAMSSRLQETREFYQQANISWEPATPDIGQISNFMTVSLIEFEIPASPVNIFAEHLFKSYPAITFNFESNIHVDRLFSVTVVSDDSDIGILWRTTNPELKLTYIPVIRNFGSTVNIVINIDCLNILNLSIDDLFPSTMRSLTPKQTTTLIGIN